MFPALLPALASVGAPALAAAAPAIGGGMLGQFGMNAAMSAISGFSAQSDQQFPSQSPMGGGGPPRVSGGMGDVLASAPQLSLPQFQGMLAAFNGR